jgi:hypothetical protein
MRLGALARSVREEHGDDALLALRALQTRTFLAELARFEATGDESDELRAVGGNVVARMQAVGWIDGHRLALAERTWRVLYKSLWARALGLSDIAPFALSLDYARGVVLFRLGRFPESARAFATVRERGGPYAERAFFHERAALVATAVE